MKAVGENEVFKVVKTGKSRSKACRGFIILSVVILEVYFNTSLI